MGQRPQNAIRPSLGQLSQQSPCGRGWRVASAASNEPGEGYFSTSTPHPADPRCTRIGHPLPQGEREERAWLAPRPNSWRSTISRPVRLQDAVGFRLRLAERLRRRFIHGERPLQAVVEPLGYPLVLLSHQFPPPPFPLIPRPPPPPAAPHLP